MIYLTNKVGLMFLRVSNYSLRPMEKRHFNVLLFLVLFISLCNSNDYKYDDYNRYDESYDYYDQKSRDYTDDYSQEYDHYAAFPIPPSLIPPPPPQPGNNIKHNCLVGTTYVIKFAQRKHITEEGNNSYDI